MVQEVYQGLVTQLDSLKQQVTTLEANYEATLSQQQPSEVNTEVEEYPAPVEPEQISSEVVNNVTAEAPEETTVVDQPVDSIEEETAQSATINQESSTYEGEVELEVLPPIEMRKIMGIIN